jgi:hypothetical protein
LTGGILSIPRGSGNIDGHVGVLDGVSESNGARTKIETSTSEGLPAESLSRTFEGAAVELDIFG